MTPRIVDLYILFIKKTLKISLIVNNLDTKLIQEHKNVNYISVRYTLDAAYKVQL